MSIAPVAKHLHDFLLEQKLRLAVAESCTGGLLSSELLANSGASNYYVGGVIAYANKVKQQLLEVQSSTLAGYGAVSAECALEMADGVRHLLRTDVGLSTTGILGPTGGSYDKPVGLVYIGLAAKDQHLVERLELKGDRLCNRQELTEAAFTCLLTWLLVINR